MPITLVCACGRQLRVADEHAGKLVKCPTCGATQAARRPAFGQAAAPQPPVQPLAAVQPAEQPRVKQPPLEPRAAAQPATRQPAAEQPAEFDDFEVVEETPTPADETPKPKARVKAVAEDEPAADPPPPPAKVKKKKKKRKKAGDEEGEEGDDWYEKARQREAWMKRILRGSAYIVAGLAILVGIGIIYFVHWENVEWVADARTKIGLIVFGLLGVAAIGKGVIGLAFGQFLGDDD